MAETIYFGGGTPSLLPLPSLAEILAACRDRFLVPPDAEISLEANPGTVDAAYLAGLRALGVNRLSLGVQSAHQAELDFLQTILTRQHPGSAQFVLLYGRRRVGKILLLRHWAENSAAIRKLV